MKCTKCSKRDYSNDDDDDAPDLTRYYAEERRFPAAKNPPYAIRTYYHPTAYGGVVCRVEHMMEPFGDFKQPQGKEK